MGNGSRYHGGCLCQMRETRTLLVLVLALSAIMFRSSCSVHSMLKLSEENIVDHPTLNTETPTMQENAIQKGRKSTLTPRKQLEQFGLIHLGKCGGVSVQATAQSFFGRWTPVGRVIRGAKLYHMAKPEVDKFDNWIVIIRDPVTRILSWWMYDHEANFHYREDYPGNRYRSDLWPRIFECFPTFDEFATKGLAPTTTIPDECRTIALMVIPLRGRSYLSGIAHLRSNFFHYFSDLLAAGEDKNVYVVRAEHMLQDLNAISEEIDDSGPKVLAVEHQSHWRTEDYPNKDRTLSPKGLENLCRHLCNEIQIYKQLLQRGINLKEDDIESSKQQLAKSCPVQASSNDCPIGMTESEWEKMVAHFKTIESREITQIHASRAIVMKERENPPPALKKHEKVELFYQPDQEASSYGFLHLGRCGGRSVRSLLESHPDSKLYPKYVNGTWTVARLPLWWKHKHWVVLVRDPIERFISWWTFHHPANLAFRPGLREQEEKAPLLRAELRFLYECFPTIHSLVSRDHSDRKCIDVANRAVPNNGFEQVPSLTDVHYGYLHLTELLSMDKFVFVVRVEFMAMDMNSIEAMLTHEPSNTFLESEVDAVKRLSSTSSWAVTANIDQIDKESMADLCRRFCYGIQRYKSVLSQAINLSHESFNKSMNKLRKNCPIQVGSPAC